LVRVHVYVDVYVHGVGLCISDRRSEGAREKKRDNVELRR
jgi:hypothetical protein